MPFKPKRNVDKLVLRVRKFEKNKQKKTWCKGNKLQGVGEG
jgi:hypothetical protein